LITFSLGIYAGIYTTQNYEVPKIGSPRNLYERAKEYIASKKKSSEE
jgi:hypothetical protein